MMLKGPEKGRDRERDRESGREGARSSEKQERSGWPKDGQPQLKPVRIWTKSCYLQIQLFQEP